MYHSRELPSQGSSGSRSLRLAVMSTLARNGTVENAIRNGSRTALRNGRNGICAIRMTAPSTNTTKMICATYMVAISLPNPYSTPTPFVATVTAIAAPTPKGARYMTYLV